MEVGSTPSTPPPQNNSEDLPKCGISELISKTYPSFDHRADIIEPFDNEAKRDAEFQEKLSEMLIELMLEFHAWSTSRPVQESDTTADKLEKVINDVMETEKEQERTRQRLGEFVERIKMALAALTGI